MTTSTATPTAPAAAPAAAPTTAPTAAPAATQRRLRALLRADAAVCGGTGLVAVLAAPYVADALGPDVGPPAVRVVGLALLVWAADAALLARTSGRRLRASVTVAAGGNLLWDAATVALVLLGAFSAAGSALALAVGAVAGGLGVLQLRALRRYSRSSGA